MLNGCFTYTALSTVYNCGVTLSTYLLSGSSFKFFECLAMQLVTIFLKPDLSTLRVFFSD